jgi:predicted cytidylate kinase
MKYKNIAISGGSGTGKTTLSNNLAKELGWKHLNNGEFVRAWYAQNAVDLNRTDQIPESVDRRIDGEFLERMKADSNTIFESRLAGWQSRDLSDVFKVLCTVDFDVALKRVSKRDLSTTEEARATIHHREEGLAEKFKKFYGVENYLDPQYFDLVVNTTTLNPQEVLEKVLEKFKKEE